MGTVYSPGLASEATLEPRAGYRRLRPTAGQGTAQPEAEDAGSDTPVARSAATVKCPADVARLPLSGQDSNRKDPGPTRPVGQAASEGGLSESPQWSAVWQELRLRERS